MLSRVICKKGGAIASTLQYKISVINHQDLELEEGKLNNGSLLDAQNNLVRILQDYLL
jgi:hypothetical protein